MKHIFKVQRESDGLCRVAKALSKIDAVAQAFPIRHKDEFFLVLCITSDGKLERCQAPGRYCRLDG